MVELGTYSTFMHSPRLATVNVSVSRSAVMLDQGNIVTYVSIEFWVDQ